MSLIPFHQYVDMSKDLFKDKTDNEIGVILSKECYQAIVMQHFLLELERILNNFCERIEKTL